MSKIYVCDRCQAKSPTWNTTSIEIPAPSFWGKSRNVDLCEACINKLRELFNNFMEVI
jgi:hypothetical protein